MHVNQHGYHIKHSKDIAIFYLKTSFAIDFVTSFPFDWYPHHLAPKHYT